MGNNLKLNITGLNKEEDSLGPGPDGTYAHIGSQGGTEMMASEIRRHVDPDLLAKFNIIHSRVRPGMIKSDKRNILVLHDTWDDPESEHLKNQASRDRFDKLVFVSNYQQSTFNLGLGVPYSDGIVIQNAIHPIESAKDNSDGIIRLIYHTTPHRGLEILVPVFDELCKHFNNIHLDVFSSFKIYGWEARDAQYANLFERIKNHPHMTYHGFQPNEVVRQYLSKSHIYAYPSIWPETSCISVIEAMSAGCMVVTTNLAALPETCANFALVCGFEENYNRLANRYANVLYSGIKMVEDNPPFLETRLATQKAYFDSFYNWQLRGSTWNLFLRNLLDENA